MAFWVLGSLTCPVIFEVNFEKEVILTIFRDSNSILQHKFKK